MLVGNRAKVRKLPTGHESDQDSEVYMKKILALVMVVSVLGAFVAGCGAKADEAAKPADAAKPAADAPK